ncbi:MAG: hypothetical protein N3E40_07870, partial [Dehalococcoidia bacterium]|nr:hypothetical protein [Dehalococcoidia bacterium]
MDVRHPPALGMDFAVAYIAAVLDAFAAKVASRVHNFILFILKGLWCNICLRGGKSYHILSGADNGWWVGHSATLPNAPFM